MGSTTDRSKADQEQRDFRFQLAERVLGRRRIYLDTCFWVRLRDELLGRSTAPGFGQLLKLLETSVECGRAICPIEATAVAEVLGQDDLTTRRATAQLMDRLGQGICIIPRPECRQAEILYFLQKFAVPASSLHHPRELVWTKAGSVMGEFVNQAWSSEEMQSVQIGFQQWLRTLGIAEVLAFTESGPPFPRIDATKTALEFNDGKFSHADELQSFAQARSIEIRGTLDGLADVFHEALLYLYSKSVGRAPSAEERADSADMTGLIRIIQEGFRKGRIGTDLPCINVPATLHAAIRWDRKRLYHPGDWGDIGHASAALPYCDLFLTDGAMASLICANHVGLDTFYGCKVVAGVDQAIEAVRGLP